MNRERWYQLMRGLRLGDNDATFDALCAAYDEPHRHYHTQRHIEDCLRQFDLLRELAQDAAAVELAIWFHDAIYDPYRTDNESRSASWAQRFLGESGAITSRADAVFRLILVTRHDAVPQDRDAALLVDVDLSILGADAMRYEEFERQVRREYRWVPGYLFRRKRREILSSFLQRDRIFYTVEFRHRLESRARENLRNAIAILGA